MPVNKKKNENEIDYRLLITRTYDETLKKEGILFFLETTKQFTNFAYVIDIQDVQNNRALTWTLHGLRAPSMIMPTTGTAQFKKVYFDLPKKVQFTFVKKGSLRVSTDLSFLKNSFSAEKPHIGFLKIYFDENEFESNRTADSIPPELKPDVHRKPIQSKNKKTL